MSSGSSTSYGMAAQEIAELFGDYLAPAGELTVLVVSERTLPDQAKVALNKSFDAFGYGSDACTFAVLTPDREDLPALDASALFMLIEGIDPLVVVSADAAVTSRLADAYRANLLLWEPLAENSEARLFGRPALVFGDFPSLLATAESKQVAWALLKTLQ